MTVPAKLTSKFWMKIHLYVSIFFLPVAMIYAVTGGTEICGYHGSSRELTLEVPLIEPLQDDIDSQQSFVAEQLVKNGLPIPRGNPQIRRGQFVWGRPTGRNVILMTQSSYIARIRVEMPDFYNQLANLHEARGGIAFNTLGVVFAIAMIVIYISGILICWKAVKLRRAIVISFLIGLAATAVAIFFSTS